MTNLKSLTITISSRYYGLGHLNRMLNFRFFLQKNKIKNEIYYVKKNFLTNYRNRINYKLNEFQELILKKKINILILDFSNKKFMENKFVENFITFLKKQKFFIVIFDDFTKKILNNFSNYKNKLIVCPYVYNKQYLKKNFLIGSKYSILKKNNKKTYNSYELNKILISCGGSDFKKLSFKIYNTLKRFKNINFGIIIGPNFVKSEIKKLEKLKNIKNVKIYKNVNNLSKLALNYDLVITTSGLTKYELASIKMRFAIICENKEFFIHHKPFSKRKYAFELGIFEDNSKFYNNSRCLVYNYKKVFKKVNVLKNDFKGAYRVIQMIKKNIN